MLQLCWHQAKVYGAVRQKVCARPNFVVPFLLKKKKIIGAEKNLKCDRSFTFHRDLTFDTAIQKYEGASLNWWILFGLPATLRISFSLHRTILSNLIPFPLHSQPALKAANTYTPRLKKKKQTLWFEKHKTTCYLTSNINPLWGILSRASTHMRAASSLLSLPFAAAPWQIK